MLALVVAVTIVVVLPFALGTSVGSPNDLFPFTPPIFLVFSLHFSVDLASFFYCYFREHSL